MAADWTSDELEQLRNMAAEGLSVKDIAARLRRDELSVDERLRLIAARQPGPAGPDEEGETPLNRSAITEDRAAWVHIDSDQDDKPPQHQTLPPPD